MKRPLVLDYMGPNETLTGSSNAMSGLLAYIGAIGEYIEHLETSLDNKLLNK